MKEEGRGCRRWDLLTVLHSDGERWTQRITQRYSEVCCGEWRRRGTGQQPSGRRMGKLKVPVYGETALADSGNRLKRGKRSIQGPAFLSLPISSLYILLMAALAVPSRINFTDSLIIFSLYTLL